MVEVGRVPGRYVRHCWVAGLVVALLMVGAFRPFYPSCSVRGPWYGPELRMEHRLAMLGEMLALSRNNRHDLPGQELVGDDGFGWSGWALSVGSRLYFLPWERQTNLTRNGARRAVRSLAYLWVVDEGLTHGPVYDFHKANSLPGGWRSLGLDREIIFCPAMEVVVAPGMPRTGFAHDMAPSDEGAPR